jgi:glycosyltransferase involved in cell wall biosynthesis
MCDMKITQIMLSQGFGGAERYFVDLCLALAAHGHRIQAICHPDFQQRHFLKNCPQLEVVCLHAYGAWDRWAAYKIKRHIAAFRPMLLHAHLARGAWLSRKAAADLNLPLVVKTHNYVKLKYYRQVDRLIPTTADQAAFLLEHGVPAEKITRIPNFSSLQAAATPRTLSHEKPVFAALGRAVKKKGFEILLRAFALYKERGNQAKLRIGGAGPELERLCQLCQVLGLTHEVEFCGWIEDVRGFLKQADIFILPSLDEPFGIVVLEAMALGLPIIATRTQGPLEILTPEAAYFIERNNIAELAAAMERALSHPCQTNYKAAMALELFKNKYALEAVLPKILQLYQALTRPFP